MNYGQSIKTLLQIRGFTQSFLAEKAKVSESCISLMIKHNIKPSGESLNRIASALDLKLEYIHFLSIERSDIPEHKREIFDFVWPHMKETFLKIFIK